MHPVLEGILRSHRIAPAYIWVGPPDSGKEAAAAEFADRLNCNKIDRINIRPDGASFKIEQVRELQKTVRYGPSAGEYQIVTVEGADAMTADAAGAFLKTLEEPPPRVVFILLVEREDRLPATIASRCQRVIFGERPKEWAPKPEWEYFYQALRRPDKKIRDCFELSSRLQAEKERIEELLYDLVWYARQELNDLALTRILLETIKNLKKQANFKLTLDVACLKTGEA